MPRGHRTDLLGPLALVTVAGSGRAQPRATVPVIGLGGSAKDLDKMSARVAAAIGPDGPTGERTIDRVRSAVPEVFAELVSVQHLMSTLERLANEEWLVSARTSLLSRRWADLDPARLDDRDQMMIRMSRAPLRQLSTEAHRVTPEESSIELAAPPRPPKAVARMLRAADDLDEAAKVLSDLLKREFERDVQMDAAVRRDVLSATGIVREVIDRLREGYVAPARSDDDRGTASSE